MGSVGKTEEKRGERITTNTENPVIKQTEKNINDIERLLKNNANRMSTLNEYDDRLLSIRSMIERMQRENRADETVLNNLYNRVNELLDEVARRKDNQKSENPADRKNFRDKTIEEKRQEILKHKQSLDSRYKSYTFGDYTVYKIGNKYEAYNFNKLSDRFVYKMTVAADAAVEIADTLKEIKKSLNV